MKKVVQTFGYKALALLLAMLTVMMALPLAVFADMIEYPGTAEIAPESASTSREPIELVELREENVKHFMLEDGTVTAALYDKAVHYLDENGAWQDIDNALHEDGSAYGTSDARVKFVKKTTGNGVLFTLHEQNRKITWGLDGAKKRVFGEVTNTETEHGEDATALQKMMTLDHLTSTILYPDILDGVDLEYVVVSGDIKEYIIVKERSDSYAYTFTVKLNGLVAELADTGEVRLSDDKTGELVYVIPRGYMLDGAGAVSHAVSYTLTDHENGSYSLTVTADAAWINAEERVLPVRIDPTVTRGTDELDVIDVKINAMYPTRSYGADEYIGVGKNAKMYWKIPELPTLPQDAYISKATFRVNAELITLASGQTSYEVALHDVLTDWDSTLCWNDTVSATPSGQAASAYTDTHQFSSIGTHTYTVTPIVKKWYNGENYGLCLSPIWDDVTQEYRAGAVTFTSSEGVNESERPLLTIVYQAMNGLEDYWSYATQDVGFAGSGAVNYASGGLTFAVPTLTTMDALFGFTPTLYYNSDVAGQYATKENTVSALTESHAPLGFHWNMWESLIDKGDYYEWVDGDGTVHAFFPGEDDCYYDRDGLLLKLNVLGAVTITDSNRTVRSFSQFSGGRCHLQSVQDSVGNAILFSHSSESGVTHIQLQPKGSDPFTQLSIYYNSAEKPYLVLNPHSGEAVILRYSESPTATSFTHATSGYLRQVVRAHGSTNVTDWQTFYQSNTNTSSTLTVDAIADYVYDTAGRITSVTNNLSQYRLAYTYDTQGRVLTVTEYADATLATVGQKIGLTYGTSHTVVRTSGTNDAYGGSDDLLTTHVYDEHGRVVTSYTTNLTQTKFYGASHAQYENEAGYAKHNIKTQSVTSQSASNYLLNGDFETGAGLSRWTTSGSVVADTSIKHSGEYSAKLWSPDGISTPSIAQNVILDGGSYTLSFFLYSFAVEGLIVTAQLLYADGTLKQESVVASNEYFGSGGFSVASFAFSFSSTEPQEFIISLNAQMSSADTPVWIDSVMLAKTTGVAETDIVELGHFESSSPTLSPSSAWQPLMSTNFSVVDSENELFDNVARIGTPTTTSSISQDIYVAPQAILNEYNGETFYTREPELLTLSGWAKGTEQAWDESALFALQLSVEYSDEDAPIQYMRLDFDKGIKEWQLTSGTLVTNPSWGLVERITVTAYYTGHPGVGYFDNICVTRNSESVQLYAYNGDGYLATSQSGKQGASYTYNTETDLLTQIQYSSGDYVTYAYNAFRQVTDEVYGHSDANGQNSILYRYGYEYHEYGMVVTTYLWNGDKTQKMVTTAAYEVSPTSPMIGTLCSVTDELGNATWYFYDQTNGRLMATLDAEENCISYEYDGIGNLIGVYEATYHSASNAYTPEENPAVTYTYDPVTKRLSGITTASSHYTFTYDVFGNVEDVGVGTGDANAAIVSYDYNDRNGKLKTITYANGWNAIYTYDTLDRVSSIVYNGTVSSVTASTRVYHYAYYYKYDAAGRLYSVTDPIQGTTTVYRYDHAGNVTGTYTYDTDDDIIQNGALFYYDRAGRLDDVYYTFDYNHNVGVFYEQIHYDYTYSQSTGYLSRLKVSNEAISDTDILRMELSISPTYDALGRQTGRHTEGLSGFYDENMTEIFDRTESYTYATTSNGQQSHRIAQYTSSIGTSTQTYRYTYDDNGNITCIRDANDAILYRYEYDALGQLVREDNAPLGKTYRYYYRDGGNLYSCREYPYTTAATPSSSTDVRNFNYNYTAGWGDLLSFWTRNGTGGNIYYDMIGNPVQIATGGSSGYHLSWQGRNLISYVGYGENTLSMSFTYNADGIRTSKTVNGVEHSYILNGSQIVAEQWGNYLLLYLYDESGAPVGLAYRTKNYDEGEYDYFFFDKNIFGDITAIYNEQGECIGTYDYDAWGQIFSYVVAGNTMLENLILTTYNPFRYRGYYYDQETGLYYLQSRYYNPEWGRFISADKVISDVGGNILGYNLFSYCRNNPVAMSDFSGMWPSPSVITNIWETWTEKSFLFNLGKIVIQNTSASAGVSIGAGGAVKLGPVETSAVARMDIVGVSLDGKNGFKMGHFGKSAFSAGIALPWAEDSVFQIGSGTDTYESFDGTIREVSEQTNDFSISYGKEAAIFFGYHYDVTFSLSGAIADFKKFLREW